MRLTGHDGPMMCDIEGCGAAAIMGEGFYYRQAIDQPVPFRAPDLWVYWCQTHWEMRGIRHPMSRVLAEDAPIG